MSGLDLDVACPHPEFAAIVEVARLTAVADGPATGYSAEVQIHCAVCDEPFIFIGLPMGLSPRRPMVDVPGTQLRAPIRPASSTAELDPGMPGFTIHPS